MPEQLELKCRFQAESVELKLRGQKWYKEGQIPLHTIRADIDYAMAEPKPPMDRSVSKCGLIKVKNKLRAVVGG